MDALVGLKDLVFDGMFTGWEKVVAVNMAILADDVDVLFVIHTSGYPLENPEEEITSEAREKGRIHALSFLENNEIISSCNYEVAKDKNLIDQKNLEDILVNSQVFKI